VKGRGLLVYDAINGTSKLQSKVRMRGKQEFTSANDSLGSDWMFSFLCFFKGDRSFPLEREAASSIPNGVPHHQNRGMWFL